MTFAREKRLLLGWLALLAPIPLPFNQVLEWPVLFIYCLALIYFLQRAERGSATWLANWSLNLLGLVYLPFFIVDIRLTFVRNSPVKALLHLIMFLILVKLFSIRREKDKWHLIVAIFFLFIGAMATSSHVSIGLYLLVFMAMALFVLGRLAHLHLLANFGETSSVAARPVPYRMPLLVGMLLILMVAIPLFAAMPRIREPFLLGRGTGASGIGRTTGFSDSVDLSLTSAIRGNRNVALRVKYDKTVGNAETLRFKAVSYERYSAEDNNWYRTSEQNLTVLSPSSNRKFKIASGDVQSTSSETAEIFLEPLSSRSLVLPMETQEIAISNYRIIGVDPGGAVVLPGLPPRETIRYEVTLADQPVISARLNLDRDSDMSALDEEGLTPAMADLAVELLGEGSIEEKVANLERELLTRYEYTTDFVGRDGENPLEDFLFTYRSGHCEYFASAMVLLLRSQGIPARFVTGFLGAEFNPLEDYFIVRQQNAHAWVEAYTPEGGWRLYDPTPPEGRPAIAPQNLRLLLTQIVDFVTFRWDRYVLTYGADDQRGFFQRLRERAIALWNRVKGIGKEETVDGMISDLQISSDGQAQAPTDLVWRPQFWLITSGCLLLLALAVLVRYWQIRALTGKGAYLKLKSDLARAGLEIPDTLAPLKLKSLALNHFPDLEESVHRLVQLYLQESFAQRPLNREQQRQLVQDLRSIQKTLKELPKNSPRSLAKAA